MLTPLIELATLTDALYQAQLAKLHKLVEAERKLRRDLDALETHQRANLALPDAQLCAPRQIGADVLWQGWVSRSRQELNRQLALVLAQKAQMMRTLRSAHGKRHAAKELLKDAQSEHRHRRDAKRNHQEQSLLLLKSHMGRQTSCL